MRLLLSSCALLAGLGCHRDSPTTTSAPTSAATSPSMSASTSAPTAPSAAPSLSACCADSASTSAWGFDNDAEGKPPHGFSFGRTGSGAMGRWEVKTDATAPSKPMVLAQLDTDPTDLRFPVAVLTAPKLEDLRLSVRCKAIAGKVDRACGLVFRYRDEASYYLTRANALENNVRLYHVVKGTRTQLAGWNGAVTSGEWHELSVLARGQELQVWWNGAKVIEAKDATLAGPGLVGVWTKADSVTYFDDLRVAAP
jgi:hypothetical protein